MSTAIDKPVSFSDLARTDETWQEVKASFALEGLSVTEEDDELAGRLIAGEISVDEAIHALRKKHGVIAEH